MSNLRTHLTALFQHNPDLGMALLAATMLLVVLIAYRKLYRKQVDSNGKIVRSPRFSLKMPTLPTSAPSSVPTPCSTSAPATESATGKVGKKPYTGWQRKALRKLYAAQEAFFGFVVFGFGLVMFIAVMVDIGGTPRALFDLLPAARCIVSLLTMITGILLIYFRDVDNPFDDS